MLFWLKFSDVSDEEKRGNSVSKPYLFITNDYVDNKMLQINRPTTLLT